MHLMKNRASMVSSNSSFADWLEKQKALQNADINSAEQESTSIFSKLSSIQDNVAIQFQDLSGLLPEGGVLSASYRQRITHAIYLIILSILFAFLAVFIGIPTLVLRPSKFVLCETLSTLLAAASVIVMQKPSVFLSSLISGGFEKSVPVVLLGISILFTLYVTIFIHKYLMVIFAGCLQLLCLAYYLASFIPGGTKGVILLARTTFAIVATALKPTIYIIKSFILSCLSKLFSS